MKVVNLKNVEWAKCLEDSQKEGIVLTKNGKPFVYMVGVKGMDLEQVEYGQSDELWTLIEKRRKQKPITRAELEKRIREKQKAKKDSRKVKLTKTKALD